MSKVKKSYLPVAAQPATSPRILHYSLSLKNKGTMYIILVPMRELNAH